MDAADGAPHVDLQTPKVIGAIASTLVALVFARKLKRKPDTMTLDQNKPTPEKDEITPPTQPTPTVGRWLMVRPDKENGYRFKQGDLYRGTFEVMGVASMFDSRSAVQSYARKFGIPLRSVQALEGDRYQVETEPIPATVRLAKHSAVKVEKIERWQAG
jgi:hypothetical protein